jgi:hypothetical protein
MVQSFLLRFQEQCLSEDSLCVQGGTKTVTRVLQEGHDQDHHSGCFRHSLAMSTVTKVAQEGTDKHVATGYHASTKTATAVRAEADDRDDERHRPYYAIG